MIAALVILTAYTITYATIGVWLARRDLPRAWAHAREEWGDTGRYVLDSVKTQAACTFLFWPLLVPARAASRALGTAVTNADPAEQEKKLKEQAQYIRKLERDLGIETDQ